ncbi:MAG TPA: hypothetical protein P5096_01370 [Patescibacteria group bacterium]|nr:hypothetical protein [Patescibacteria group bacterium]
MQFNRKHNILTSIIEEYITTGEPVGSKGLSGFFGFSSATIRSEMVRLEKEGLIMQPHTSAGRVPTEKGLRKYVDSLKIDFTKVNKDDIKRFAEKKGMDKVLKVISSIAGGNTAFYITPKSIRYYGLSETLKQKEFDEKDKVVRFAKVIDNLPDFVQLLEFDEGSPVKVYIGKENVYKFAQDFSCVTVYFPFGKELCVLGVIGPIRMPYRKIIPYLLYTSENFRNKKLIK